MSLPNEHASLKRRRPERKAPFLLLVITGLLALGFSSCDTLRPHEHRVHESAKTQNFADTHDDAFKYCPLETVRQSSKKTSGLAALVSVMNYWEHEATVDTLGEKYPAESEDGYPLLQLRRIAAKEGLIAFALTLNDQPLAQVSEQLENGRPVIVPVVLPRGRYFTREAPATDVVDATSANPEKPRIGGRTKNHYVVIFGQSAKQFLLMDPAYGIVKINKDEFVTYWGAEQFAALLCSSF